MNLSGECITCTMGWIYERLIAGAQISREEEFELMRSILKFSSESFTYSTSPAKVTNFVIEHLKEFLSLSKDYFENIKANSNMVAKSLIYRAESYLNDEKDIKKRLTKAINLSLHGNVAPIGKPSSPFGFVEIQELLNGSRRLYSTQEDLLETLLHARKLVFVADNAGEIGFDSLLIKELQNLGIKITLIVKNDYFFDDATIRDAEYFNIDKIVDDIIGIKYLLVFEELERSVKLIINETDAIISKGTGNFETMKDEIIGCPVIMLLKIKCKPIQDYSAMPLGEFLMYLRNSKD